MVDVKFDRKLKRFISLKEIQSHKDIPCIAQMALLRQSRLSVSPVSTEAANFILSLEEKEIGN